MRYEPVLAAPSFPLWKWMALPTVTILQFAALAFYNHLEETRTPSRALLASITVSTPLMIWNVMKNTKAYLERCHAREDQTESVSEKLFGKWEKLCSKNASIVCSLGGPVIFPLGLILSAVFNRSNDFPASSRDYAFSLLCTGTLLTTMLMTRIATLRFEENFSR